MKAPRFLYSTALSECHQSKSLLVRSRDGGFVSRNCLRCGKPSYVSVHQLPELCCDFCDAPLVVRKIDGTNYFYVCDHCGQQWQLSEFLPHWSELFSYCGLFAEGDAP
jgi:DNA-directed RNA polymerase subunit M/transcription elongation factor TFIIS